jgi:quercetin dioxygenase-like cupin family protein
MIIKHLDEIPKEVPKMEGIKDVTLQWLFNRRDGTKNYAMRVFELKPGGMIPMHEHSDMEHEIFILEGRGTATTPEKGFKVKEGDALFVLPGERHGYINDSDKIFRFLCVIPVVEK